MKVKLSDTQKHCIERKYRGQGGSTPCGEAVQETPGATVETLTSVLFFSKSDTRMYVI